MNTPLKTRDLEIMGLFPSLDSNVYGGVQASGRDAWQGIVNRIGAEHADVLYYEAGTSKAKAVLRAVSSRKTANVVLIWHLHLLKLLPFLDHAGSRVFLFLHGIEAWCKHDRLTQLLLRRVDVILSNSDHTWSRFLKCNPQFQNMPHRTVHLGAGAILDAVTPSPSDPPAVLMVGRLNAGEDYKGHRQMIEAWPRVVDRIPDAELRILGDGDLRQSLEDLARRQAPPHSVRFFGQTSDAEKEQLLAQCRCLALPSRGEGFGLVYLEAMRVGRPCMVSDVDAGREVVNPPEAGLAVDPDNPHAVAEAVHRMLTLGEEWTSWSGRARARYEDRFTTEQFHRRLVSALFDA